MLNASHNSISLCGEVGHLKSKVQHGLECLALLLLLLLLLLLSVCSLPSSSVCVHCAVCAVPGLYAPPNQWVCSFISCMFLATTNAVLMETENEVQRVCVCVCVCVYVCVCVCATTKFKVVKLL